MFSRHFSRRTWLACGTAAGLAIALSPAAAAAQPPAGHAPANPHVLLQRGVTPAGGRYQAPGAAQPWAARPGPQAARPTAPRAAGNPGALQQDFTAAAAAYHIPVQVLLGVSYQESLWEANGGKPRYAGGYGPMNLTDLTQAILTADGFGGDAQRTSDLLNSPALHTLPPAASLAGVSDSAAMTSVKANIEAGAALLASYEKKYDHGQLPATPSDWYVAVAAYSQAAEPFVARQFADAVTATIRAGATRTTKSGQVVTLQADPSVRTQPGTIGRLGLKDVTLPPANPVMDPRQIAKPECPASLHCIYSPSGYWQYGPSKGYYGDHDMANRPKNLSIRYVTLHDNEETGNTTLWLFHDPTYLASANYEVFADGTVVQLVPDRAIAWDSGNPAFYQHSVGIEQEGFAIDGSTWYTPQLYRATAALVRYLTAKYGIPRDRAHILGHDSVPGGNCDVCIAAQHWDPGPFWNWGLFMKLIGAPIHRTAPPSSNVVTIDPAWRSNQTVVTGTEPIQDLAPYPSPYHGPEWANLNANPPASFYVRQPKQPVSFVWLRTRPSASAPLLSDPYLHGDPYVGTPAGPGTIRANDWGDKAVTGNQYVVAGRQGNWTAIWYAGTKAWFYNPPGRGATAVPARAPFVVTPKPGLSSIPVYVDDYPLTSDYPAKVLQKLEYSPPLHAATDNYTIKAGQSYVAGGPAFNGDWYYAANIDGSAPYDRTDFPGSDRFYLITYNHRMAFVNADDVTVSPSTP